MTTRWKRVFAAAIASVVVTALLAGCSNTRQRTEDPRVTVEKALVETVPTVTGALVNVFTGGIGSQGLAIKLYVDDATPETLAVTIDTALRTAWKVTPRSPSDISISAVDGPKPADPHMGSMDGVDLSDVATSLGFDPSISSLDVLTVPNDALTDRYGAWKKPADK